MTQQIDHNLLETQLYNTIRAALAEHCEWVPTPAYIDIANQIMKTFDQVLPTDDSYENNKDYRKGVQVGIQIGREQAAQEIEAECPDSTWRNDCAHKLLSRIVRKLTSKN